MSPPDPHDDAALVARCLETKEAASAAFDQLYGRHAGAVLAFLSGMLRGGDGHTVQDALQETFVRFYGALARFDRERPLRPYLMRIARNVVLDARKRKSAGEVPAAPDALGAHPQGTEASPPEAAARSEAAALLRQAVDGLPDDERAVFLLRHDQGLTYAQVADALACSVRTAKYRMKAALARIGREAERLGVEA